MPWITPVFDRTLEDAVYGNPKGCVDAVTLNRIEGNTNYLFQRFKEHHIPYGIDYVPVLRAWDRTKYIRVSTFNDIKHNIMHLRASAFRYNSTPILTDSQAYDGVPYTELNDMEKILYDINQLLESSRTAARVEGTFTLGSNYQRQYIRSVR